MWNFEVKCLKSNEYLSEHLLLQAMRNSLRGVARDMLIPLAENASVDDILQKLDGFFGNVATTQTLMQSFYSDCQKEDESIVAFGSRLEHTLSRAIESGHIDSIAKDAMLCSKFWTGLKSQTLNNSTRYLYSNVSDFQTLLKEIRKVDMENSSTKTTKKQSAQQLRNAMIIAIDATITVVVAVVFKEVHIEVVMVGVIKMITIRTNKPVIIGEAMEVDASGIITVGAPTAEVLTKVIPLGVRLL